MYNTIKISLQNIKRTLFVLFILVIGYTALQDTHAENIPFVIQRQANIRVAGLAKRFGDQKNTVFPQLIRRFTEIKTTTNTRVHYVFDAYIIALKEHLGSKKPTVVLKEGLSQYGFGDSVDISVINQQRAERLNAERISGGRKALTVDSRLVSTAQVWANTLAQKYKNGVNVKTVHERRSGDGYYSFAKIQDWFAMQGLEAPHAGVWFSEGVGYNYVQCPNSGSCTEKIKSSIQSTRKFFMSEKSYNGVHYRAMMQPGFNQIGVGVAHDGKRYWIVIHYATQL